MTFYLIWFPLLAAALALPVWFRTDSLGKFLVATIKVAAGILWPLVVFAASALCVPEWKGGCKLGWLDCFHMGKLALLPLVMLAAAALYAVEVLEEKHRTEKWVVLCLVNGAVISLVCLGHGLLTLGFTRGMWNPFYVAVWYGFRAVQSVRLTRVSGRAYFLDQAATLPFWTASLWFSYKNYLTLPDAPPNCFVATAAAQGHPAIVGPHFLITRQGQERRVNAQLLTLWSLEAFWRQHHPRSHQLFRSIYNVWGYRAARCLRNPWLADAAFLLLKPLELAAVMVLRRPTGRP